MTPEEIKICMIEVLLVDKRARYKRASDYVYNMDMHIECDLLNAEIRALENKAQELKQPKGKTK